MSIAGARINALDGVRAASILLVLVAHLLPVKAAGRSYNDSVGVLGMALFFALSGYLISQQAGNGQSPTKFLTRRFARVVPAAWLCIGIVALFVPMSVMEFLRHLLFISNLPPQTLGQPLEHFWSLCVEVQFYVFVALFMRAGLPSLSTIVAVLLVSVTVLRIWMGVNGTSYTWYRIDDILAGAMLGFLMQSHGAGRLRQMMGDARLLWMVVPLLAMSSYIPDAGSLNALSYARPYLAASLLAIVVCADKSRVVQLLSGRRLAYIAAISYALYIWHKPLAATWLGSGDLVEKYAKRPLLFAVLLLVAHLSTFVVEKYFNDYARRKTHPAN